MGRELVGKEANTPHQASLPSFPCPAHTPLLVECTRSLVCTIEFCTIEFSSVLLLTCLLLPLSALFLGIHRNPCVVAIHHVCRCPAGARRGASRALCASHATAATTGAASVPWQCTQRWSSADQCRADVAWHADTVTWGGLPNTCTGGVCANSVQTGVPVFITLARGGALGYTRDSTMPFVSPVCRCIAFLHCTAACTVVSDLIVQTVSQSGRARAHCG